MFKLLLFRNSKENKLHIYMYSPAGINLSQLLPSFKPLTITKVFKKYTSDEQVG